MTTDPNGGVADPVDAARSGTDHRTPELGSDSSRNDAGDSGADDAAPATAAETALSPAQLLEREGDLAADYLETLLDIADLDGDIDMDIEGERATVAIVGADLDRLVGAGGDTLEALQELTRLAVARGTGSRSRLMLDIGGFRQRRRIELSRVGLDAADEVTRSGEPKRLAPMTPFERKVVHDAVAGVPGVVSESEGEEPERRVVVRRA